MIPIREHPMLVFCKALLCELVGLLAPLVCLFYRQGWFVTPDDPVSPHGQYEPKMCRIRELFGNWVADWWWLGVRNRAYGLRYALKPEYFKTLSSYENLPVSRYWRGPVRVTKVSGFAEYALSLKRFHVIYGLRMTPIYNEIKQNAVEGDQPKIPFRPVNMDARPIFSIRSGFPD
jgi:hypothetical protein